MTGPKLNDGELLVADDQPITKATAKYLRGSASKAREVLDLIRGLDVRRADEVLQFTTRDVAKDGDWATLRMPSTEMRRVQIDCRATVGEVGNAEHELIKVGKAGRNRWKGVKPQTRGVAMNPVDHPLGGGEGRTSGGRPAVSPWGQPEGRTRDKNKPSQSLIVRRRRTGKGRR